MALHLTVGDGLAALVDPLAEVLSHVPDDPFAPHLVAVPGEGVRSWLTWVLGERLGGRHGIVANIDWVFPSTLVRRALTSHDAVDPWSVEVLTWAIHAALTSQPIEGAPEVQADLARARAVADLFDRYGARRPGMVAAWERGYDVDVFGRPLPDLQRWQPRLWRSLVARGGQPSTAVQSFDRLAHLLAAGPPSGLPGHVVLVGVTGLPSFPLEVLAALARHREVWVLSPVPSPDLWHRLGEVLARQQRDDTALEVARADDPTASLARHPLLTAWGRASREAQFHLARTALSRRVEPRVVTVAPPPGTSWLGALHSDLRADRLPEPPPQDVDDRSVRWHRCHGPARQAEVLRDVLLHLFEERDDQGRPRFEPRDVAVLCPDVAVFGPVIQAACAGAPEQGVPAVPVRVADRTLGGEAPLVDVVTALVGLLDRRWRRDDVVGVARLAAVRRRFGLTADQVGLLAEWLDATNVKWGLTPLDHRRAGLPEGLTAHSMQSGLDQLVVGAVMSADVTMGPAGVAATGDLEGDDLDVVGAFADLVERLGAIVDDLAQPTTVADWVRRLETAVGELAELPDTEAWQWGALRRELAAFVTAADTAQSSLDVDPQQLGDLVVARLGARSGRVRFDTGAVTVSSLAGQRGVPRRVICLVGLDEHLLSAGLATADDLVAATPVVGDPDARAEIRALLLDAVLAAQERLLLFSTGFEVRSNDPVAPAVALAELIDTMDRLAGGSPARGRWVVDHPRQPWSPRSFVPGALGEPGPFSFHRGALAMFRRAQGRRHQRPLLEGRLPAETGDRDLGDLGSALDHAVKALLRDRCGLWLPDTAQRSSDLMPLSVGGLDAWGVRHDALQAVLTAPTHRQPEDVVVERLELARRRGDLPPLALGQPAVDRFQHEVLQVVAEARRCGVVLGQTPSMVDVGVPLPGALHRWLTGRVDGVSDHQLVRVTVSRFQPGHLLRAWVDLAALTVLQPDVPWEAVVVSRGPTGGDPVGHVLRLVSPDAARHALAVAAQFTDRARQGVLPLTAAWSEAWFRGGRVAGQRHWYADEGLAHDAWMQWAVAGAELDDLLAMDPWPDEEGDDWGHEPGRLQRWSHRLWTTYSATLGDHED